MLSVTMQSTMTTKTSGDEAREANAEPEPDKDEENEILVGNAWGDCTEIIREPSPITVMDVIHKTEQEEPPVRRDPFSKMIDQRDSVPLVLVKEEDDEQVNNVTQLFSADFQKTMNELKLDEEMELQRQEAAAAEAEATSSPRSQTAPLQEPVSHELEPKETKPRPATATYPGRRTQPSRRVKTHAAKQSSSTIGGGKARTARSVPPRRPVSPTSSSDASSEDKTPRPSGIPVLRHPPCLARSVHELSHDRAERLARARTKPNKVDAAIQKKLRRSARAISESEYVPPEQDPVLEKALRREAFAHDDNPGWATSLPPRPITADFVVSPSKYNVLSPEGDLLSRPDVTPVVNWETVRKAREKCTEWLVKHVILPETTRRPISRPSKSHVTQ